MAAPNLADEPATAASWLPVHASVIRYLVIAVSYLVLYLALDKAIVALETSPGISPWYPPVGLSLALLLSCGLSYIPVVLLALLLTLTLNPCCQSSPLIWLSLAPSSTLGYSLAVLVLRRVFTLDLRLRRLQDVIWFVAVILAASLMVGLLAVIGFVKTGLIAWSAYPTAVLNFAVGDAIGIVILTPFLLIHLAPQIQLWLSTARLNPFPFAREESELAAWGWPAQRTLVQVAAQAVVIGAVLWLSFDVQFSHEAHLLYLCFLPLIWFALRYGLPGATIGILVMNVGVILAVRLFGFTVASLVGFQLFMLTLSFTGLLLGAVVSENRRSTATLRQSELHTRALLNAIPDMMFRFDRTGTILDFHAQSDSVFPVSPARIIGANLRQAPLPPAVIEDILHLTTQALATERVQTFEYALNLDNGLYDFEARIVASGRNEVVAIVRNITERKRTEEKLIGERNLLRTLLDILPDYIFIKDRQSRFVLINAAYARFLGAASPDEVIGKTGFDFYPAEMAAQFDADDLKVIGANYLLLDHEEISQNSDGERRLHWVTKVPLRNSQGEVIGLVGRGHDITERQQAEAKNIQLLHEVDQQHSQLRALHKRLAEIQEAERKALARELHDEVGQNLSLLAINLKILQTQIAVALATDQAVSTRLKDSQALVQQITQRIRHVMANLRPPVLDDYGVFAALEWYAARVARQTDLVIHVQGEELSPRPAAAVEHALFRITQEALTNIVKHAEATQVHITLTATDNTLQLIVADDGCGIDPALLNGKAPQETWGLINMRERAEIIGGRFQIISGQGQGTAITIELDRGKVVP